MIKAFKFGIGVKKIESVATQGVEFLEEDPEEGFVTGACRRPGPEVVKPELQEQDSALPE